MWHIFSHTSILDQQYSGEDVIKFHINSCLTMKDIIDILPSLNHKVFLKAHFVLMEYIEYQFSQGVIPCNISCDDEYNNLQNAASQTGDHFNIESFVLFVRKLNAFIFDWGLIRHSYLLFVAAEVLSKQHFFALFYGTVLFSESGYNSRMRTFLDIYCTGITDHWLCEDYHLKQSKYFQTYPPYHLYSTCKPNETLPPLLSNEIISVLPYLDYALQRVIEYDGDHIIHEFAMKIDRLYKFHDAPVRFVEDTFRYYYSYSNPVVNEVYFGLSMDSKLSLLQLLDITSFTPRFMEMVSYCKNNNIRNIGNLIMKQFVDQHLPGYLEDLYTRLKLKSFHNPIEINQDVYYMLKEFGGKTTHSYQYHIATIELLTIGHDNWFIDGSHVIKYPYEIGGIVSHLPTPFYSKLFQTIVTVLPQFIAPPTTLPTAQSYSMTPGHLTSLNSFHTSKSTELTTPITQFITMFHSFFQSSLGSGMRSFVQELNNIVKMIENKSYLIISVPQLFVIYKLVAPFVYKGAYDPELTPTLALALVDLLSASMKTNIGMVCISNGSMQGHDDLYLLEMIANFVSYCNNISSNIIFYFELVKKIRTLPDFIQELFFSLKQPT
eukprot:TRINITY_DN3575_c0_g2_i3.p1 TRINITY_DN3575_c0_g2~~TRINITY_DN3575_c0_g2_i3.p1  ORF type:complete len:605 (+),score=90.45 TRINITY_DN3575_c0_g2_i3:208-2022(+)